MASSAFAKLSHRLRDKGAKNPQALAAWIGRRKYGKRKFQQMALAGKHRKHKR